LTKETKIHTTNKREKIMLNIKERIKLLLLIIFKLFVIFNLILIINHCRDILFALFIRNNNLSSSMITGIAGQTTVYLNSSDNNAANVFIIKMINIIPMLLLDLIILLVLLYVVFDIVYIIRLKKIVLPKKFKYFISIYKYIIAVISLIFVGFFIFSTFKKNNFIVLTTIILLLIVLFVASMIFVKKTIK
jgi:uncharacterized membrane protein